MHRPSDIASHHTTRQFHVFTPEVNGLLLGFLAVEDRDRGITTSANIWLRYLGPCSSPSEPLRGHP